MLAKKETLFEIGDVGAGIPRRGNDFYAISKGFISVTPLTINMTNKTIYEKVKRRYEY